MNCASATDVFVGNFLEAATGCVLWKKLFLKISRYSKSCRPATLLKGDSNTGVFF